MWGGNIREENSKRTLFRSERRQEVKGMVCEAGLTEGRDIWVGMNAVFLLVL
jgi:hypothetical protein